MIYMISSIGSKEFKVIQKKFPEYKINFSGIRELNDVIVKEGIPEDVKTIVIVSPILDNSMDKNEILKLSSNLRSLRSDISVIAAYTDPEFMRKHRLKVEELFANIRYYQFHGNPQLNQFGELAKEEEREVRVDEKNDMRKKIGIISTGEGKERLIMISSISYLVSKRVRGRVGIIETGLSIPEFSEYLEEEPQKSVYDTYLETKEFNYQDMDFITQNLGVGSIPKESRMTTSGLVGFIRTVNDLEYAFIDLGTNSKIMEQEILTRELDEIWVIVSPKAGLTQGDLIENVPDGLKGKVYYLFYNVDEYTLMRMEESGVTKGLESSVLCITPNIESNWISKSLWEKTLLPQIPEYLPFISKILEVPVKHLLQ